MDIPSEVTSLKLPVLQCKDCKLFDQKSRKYCYYWKREASPKQRGCAKISVMEDKVKSS